MRAIDAQKVINLRENAGLTQGQLAEHVGMSPSAVSMIESAETKTPRQATREKLAAFFDVTMDHLEIDYDLSEENADLQLQVDELTEQVDALKGKLKEQKDFTKAKYSDADVTRLIMQWIDR
tara:strand:- start:3319 stop:3684 length:366 start_codon:yes stop_codon:yes gene_type:complete